MDSNPTLLTTTPPLCLGLGILILALVPSGLDALNTFFLL